MTWPSSDVSRTNCDATGDNPQSFRADVLDLIDKFNLLRNHVSSFIQGLLIATNAAAARATLGAAISGTNNDITSLSSPAIGAATCTTQAVNTNTTQVANTAFVMAQGAYMGPASAAQTKTNVAGSRAIGTVYTNSTGRAIVVMVRVTGGTLSPHRATIDGDVVQEHTEVSSSYVYSFLLIVPNGATYSITQGGTGASVLSWWEIR